MLERWHWPGSLPVIKTGVLVFCAHTPARTSPPARTNPRQPRPRPSRPSARRVLALRDLQLARIGEGHRLTPAARRGHRLAVDPDRVVDAHHHEVARRRPAQGQADRGHLVEDLLDLGRAARAVALGGPGSLADMTGRLAGGPPAQDLVLADDQLVERGCRDRAIVALVLVGSIARNPDHADR